MQIAPVKVKKLDDRAIIPTYGSEFSAGADLYAVLDEELTIMPGETILIHTGLSMEIPVGYVGLIYARSGLASKKGLAPGISLLHAKKSSEKFKKHFSISHYLALLFSII